MYMRVVRTSLQADQIDKFIRIWKGYFPMQFSQMPGFRNAYVGYDPATNAIASVSIWDANPGEEVLADIVAEFRPQVQDISSGPPAFEEYEVLADI